MKRLLPLLSSLLLLFVPLPRTRTEAEESPRYAVAATETVWFYAAEDEESGLFLLPYTYYVRVLREGVTFCAVQYLDDVAPYKSVTGYCRTDALTFVDFVPERPFLRREIKVAYTLPSENQMGSGSFDRIERSFVYYGASYAGTAKYFYVYADGVFDYIPAMQEIVFELNTDYLQAPAPDPPAETAGTPVSPLSVVLLCALAATVLAAAALLLRKKKPAPPPQEFPEF